MTAVSFITGMVLGGLHVYLFHRGLSSLFGQGDVGQARKGVLLGSVFRHLIVFSAGISLVRIAHFGAIGLGLGLMTTFFCYRLALTAQAYWPERIRTST